MMADAPPPPAAVQPVESLANGEFLMREIETADGPRRFKLYLPTGYDKPSPVPLLVVLHGCTQDPDDIARGTRFNALAEESTMIVAYPEQPQTANGLKCWNWFDPSHQKRDKGEPALIASIARRVMQDYSVDARRVYIAGISAGGAMALTVSYAYPEIFAAAGIHSGIPYGAAASIGEAMKAMGGGASDSSALASLVEKGMGSRRSIPAIVFYGAVDKSVKVVNGRQIVSQLLALRGDSSPLPKREVAGRSGASGHAFTQTLFGEGTPVIEEWNVHELGHAWSGGSKDGTYTDPAGPDASREMLRFFLAHPRT